MHPNLFKIGPLEIHSYGLMLAVSFLLGILLAMHRAKRQNIEADRNAGGMLKAILAYGVVPVIRHYWQETARRREIRRACIRMDCHYWGHIRDKATGISAKLDTWLAKMDGRKGLVQEGDF